MIQAIASLLYFYVFALASVMLTWYCVVAVRKYFKEKEMDRQKEERQQH